MYPPDLTLRWQKIMAPKWTGRAVFTDDVNRSILFSWQFISIFYNKLLNIKKSTNQLYLANMMLEKISISALYYHVHKNNANCNYIGPSTTSDSNEKVQMLITNYFSY